MNCQIKLIKSENGRSYFELSNDIILYIDTKIPFLFIASKSILKDISIVLSKFQETMLETFSSLANSKEYKKLISDIYKLCPIDKSQSEGPANQAK